MMGSRLFIYTTIVGLSLQGWSTVWAEETAKWTPGQKISFGQHIYPVLHNHCFKCHQGSDASSGIRLDSRAAFLSDKLGEPVVMLKASLQSPLLHRISGQLPDERMPPPEAGRELNAAEVGLFQAWIEQGLPWDNKVLPPPDAAQTHWAFQPVKRPPVPPSDKLGWVRTPIDAFIAADHAVHGLTSVGEAGRRTLLRRLTLDLTGLPPTRAEMASFLADSSSHAYENQVERLLNSVAYGERWGRHWLDVARYADTEGYESNHPRPYAWRYRDWVVQSFHRDLPYDQFLRHQLAGDEITPYADDHLIATGFLAAARISSNEEDKRLQRNEVLVDIVNAVGNSLLGLTFGCAQCHSHKFDPLSHRDYYRFQGFFVQGQPANLELKSAELWGVFNAAKPPEYDSAVQLREALLEQGRMRLIADTRQTLSSDMLAALDTPDNQRNEQMQELVRQADLKFQFSRTAMERAIAESDRKLFDELKKKLTSLEKKMPDRPQVWGYYSPQSSPHNIPVLPSVGFYPLPYEPDMLKQEQAYLLLRGEVHQRGPAVGVGWHTIFGAPNAKQQQLLAKSPRLALADWLTDRQNPLTARVWANRVWYWHFGRGLVPSVEDFGLKGESPTHPQLLDWLAAELMENGWSTKNLHRLIVLSSTYRQAAEPQSTQAKLDPENVYYWRWSPRRLEAEAIRDSVLLVSGEIDLTAGGPFIAAEQQHATSRRTLYLMQRRDQLPEVQQLFDSPTTNESCSRRYTSTVALQPLFLLNHEFMVRRTARFATLVASHAGPSRTRQIEFAFEQALGRLPNPSELSRCQSYFQQQSEDEKVLESFCHALLNVNEFFYIE